MKKGLYTYAGYLFERNLLIYDDNQYSPLKLTEKYEFYNFHIYSGPDSYITNPDHQ